MFFYISSSLPGKLITSGGFMKKLLLAFVISSNVLAADNITFQIERLRFQGDHGEVTSKEISVGEGTDSIGFKSDNDLFEGDILIKDKDLEITASNGMFIKSISPVQLKDVPVTIVNNGIFYSTPLNLGLKAEQMSTSVSNVKLDISHLNFNCVEKANCNALASHLIVDSNMVITSPVFTCEKANCINNFNLEIGNLDDGKSFTAFNAVDKSLIDLKDLRSISLKRLGNELALTGKVHVLIGVISFELGARIVTLNKDILELHIGKVKLAKMLSVRDFTMFLASKILSSKSFTMNGDNLIIKLR